jgi:peptidoglycan/LPS O-acetylase OafA/YrhL
MAWSAPDALARNNFDFLRFALAALVIFSHSFALLGPGDATEPLARLTRGQLPSGHLAVDFFFVISGFLITHSALRSRSLLDYLRKRAARIYPGFLLAALFCFLVVAPLAGHRPASITPLAAGILSLRGYEPGSIFTANPYPNTLNGSLWSISYEAWCYVGVALLAATSLLARRHLLLAVFIASLAGSTLFAVYQLRPGAGILGVIFGSPRLWARLLPCYLAGMVFYLHRDRIPFSSNLALACAIALVVGARIPHALTSLVPTAATYLLFYFAFHPAIRLDRWARRGDFSYGIYLYAFPIQQLLILYIPSLRASPLLYGPLLLFALALPLSIAFGAVNWHLAEKHFVRRHSKAGLTSRPAGAQLPPPVATG